MKPIPTSFHIGPIQAHTYGIGIAIAFFVGYQYLERRLARHGVATDWLPRLLLVVLVAAIAGARLLHVVAHASYYGAHLVQIVAIWHGGLSSFGGLACAVPAGLFVVRRRCPALSLARVMDIAAPVLALSWSIGRILGPQMMVAGGGPPTSAFYGMYYAGQVGRRVPVPVFQCLEDAAIWGALLMIERALRRSGRNVGSGFIVGIAMFLWGIERGVDEFVWLARPGQIGDVGVEVAGLCFSVAGAVIVARCWRSGSKTLEVSA